MKSSNDNNLIKAFLSADTFYKMALQESNDAKKVIRLLKRAIETTYQDCIDKKQDVSNIDALYPDLKKYYISLADAYGDLGLFHYMHLCLFNILGDNNAEDNAVFKQLFSDEHFKVTNVARLLNVLTELHANITECYLKIFDNVEKPSSYRRKSYGDFNIVTKDGQIVPANIVFAKEDVHLNIAEQLMVRQQFDKAIEVLKTVNIKANADARANLAICYFLNNQIDLAIDVTLNSGEQTITDRNNLLMFYYELNEMEKYDLVKKDILASKKIRPEEAFKIGITFSQVGEHDLAKKYINIYLKHEAADLRAQLLYAIACINCGDIEAATEKLRMLLDIDMYDQLVYKDYLELCQKPIKGKIEYNFDIQYKSSFKYNAIIDRLVALDDEEFGVEILNYLDLIGWAAKSNLAKGSMLLLTKASRVNNALVLQQIEQVLNNTFIDRKIKHLIILEKLNNTMLYKTKIGYVDYGRYHRIVTKHTNVQNGDEEIIFNLKDIKQMFPTVYDALCMSVMCIVEKDEMNSTNNILISFNEFFKELEKFKPKSIGMENKKYYLAAFFTEEHFLAYKEQYKKVHTLFEKDERARDKKFPTGSQICKYFNIDKDVYKEFCVEVLEVLASKKEILE